MKQKLVLLKNIFDETVQIIIINLIINLFFKILTFESIKLWYDVHDEMREMPLCYFAYSFLREKKIVWWILVAR